LNPLEFGPYTEALDSGEYDIAWIYRVSDYADPDSFYYPLLYSANIDGGGNIARYSNEDVDALVEAGRMTVDEAERLEAYGQIDEQFAQDLPYIPLTHNIYADIHQPYVENYVPSPMDLHLYHRVWISDETE
jgi:ABC-type transport system substrate-binding protein